MKTNKKKTIGRLRKWLIHKLGGYLPPEKPLIIEHAQLPIVRLHYDMTIPLWEAKHMDSEQAEYLGERLIYELLNEAKHYVEIEQCDNLFENIRTYRVTLRIAGEKVR